MDFEAFILKDFIAGLTSGMKLKKLNENLNLYLISCNYNFNIEKYSEMYNNIKEENSDKLHIALGQLINMYDEMLDLINGCNVIDGEKEFEKIINILSKVINRLKRRPIIIDMREKSIEIDGLEVSSIVFKFVELKERQWYKNGKALGLFAWYLGKECVKKETSDENKSEFNSISKNINIDKKDNQDEKYEQHCTPQ